MVSVAIFSGIVLSLFILDHLLQIWANPASLTETPTADDSIDVVDQSATNSIGIFAIVLVVIQFTMDEFPLKYYGLLALSALSLSSGFLILTFMLELFGSLRVFLHRLQITSLRYAGLLLFLGLYLLLISMPIPAEIYQLLGIFVVLAWIMWIVHELDYIFITQRREWRDNDQSKSEWMEDQISYIYNRIRDIYYY